MVAPDPAACRLDRGAETTRDRVNPVAVRLWSAREFDGVAGAWRAIVRVRRIRVARAVAGRGKRCTGAWNRAPDALREELRAPVVDLHVDVVGVHHPLVRVGHGENGEACRAG